MDSCARCGADGADYSVLAPQREYKYCEGCREEFREVNDNGVVARSRHFNRAFNECPFEVAVRVDTETPKEWRDNRRPQSQVEALGEAKKAMEAYEVPGLFIYQKTGSVWLIQEYLDTHRSIRQDVDDYIKSTESSDQGGLLSRLL